MPFDYVKRQAAEAKNLQNLPRYVQSEREFTRLGGVIDERRVLLGDLKDAAGSVDQHYFKQDILVAEKIFQSAPPRHIDVGSRIDGFVSHLAVFRQVEIIDIRPQPRQLHPRIIFTQGNLMNLDPSLRNATSSLSCLHTLEHFGLGRYGDPIMPNGHELGLHNLTQMLTTDGTAYISVPVGQRRTVFNAHRIFSPEDFPKLAEKDLELVTFDFIDDQGDLHLDSSLEKAENLRYGCGIYTFRKLRT